MEETKKRNSFTVAKKWIRDRVAEKRVKRIAIKNDRFTIKAENRIRRRIKKIVKETGRRKTRG